jgi:hypothetical protein
MKKILISFFILLILIYFLHLYDLKNQNFYHDQFEATQLNGSVQTIVELWGEPTTIVNRKDEIVFFYDKDWLNWERFAFIFTKKDSILVRKSIDD